MVFKMETMSYTDRLSDLKKQSAKQSDKVLISSFLYIIQMFVFIPYFLLKNNYINYNVDLYSVYELSILISYILFCYSFVYYKYNFFVFCKVINELKNVSLLNNSYAYDKVGMNFKYITNTIFVLPMLLNIYFYYVFIKNIEIFGFVSILFGLISIHQAFLSFIFIYICVKFCFFDKIK